MDGDYFQKDKEARENSAPVWMIRMFSELVTDMLAEYAKEWEEAAERHEGDEDKDENTIYWQKRIAQEFWEASDQIYHIQRRLGICD